VETIEKEDRSATRNNVNPNGPNGEAIKGVRPLTSVELLDAAVWREIERLDEHPCSLSMGFSCLFVLRCRLSHPAGFMESSGYNHGNEFSERIGFHFLHYTPAVFLDGANCYS